MSKIIVSQVIAPPFHDVHRSIVKDEYAQIWLKGGRGSTKSSFTAIEIILGIMRDPNANCLALRKVGDTVRGSIHQTFLWAINMLGVEEYFNHTTSPAEITYLPTGQKIIMKGSDKPEKLKGINLAKGYFKFVWFEELAEFDGAHEVRNILQSTLRGGTKFLVFMSYNPPDDEHNWVNRESDHDVPGRLVHHSTYLDVPEEWLGDQFIHDADILKKRDYERYRHEYLGEVVGNADKLVMAGRWSVGERDTKFLDGPYYGADWGFAKDPNVLCKLWIDWDEFEIYVEHAKFGYKTELDDLPELFDAVPGARDHVVRADSARPETISYLKRHGYSGIKGVKKWNGSVEEGVNYMKGFHWVFHPDCKEAIEEAKNWSYQVNRAGDILSKLEDKFNHFWDSARYALAPLIKKRDNGEDVVVAVTTGGVIGGEVAF